MTCPSCKQPVRTALLTACLTACLTVLAAGATICAVLLTGTAHAQPAQVDHLSFVHGALPVAIGGDAGPFGVRMEQALRIIDGHDGQFSLRPRPGTAAQAVSITYARSERPFTVLGTATRVRHAGKGDSTTLAASVDAQSKTDAPADTDPLRVAVERSLPLLQSSADQWLERRSCASCHHQALGSMAVAVAREAGFAIDTASLGRQLRRSLSVSAGWLERYAMLEASINEPVGQSYRAVGVAAGGYPATPVTDAVVYVVAGRQHASGRWTSSSRRPPHEDSDFTATALSIRTLQLYSPEAQRSAMRTRIDRARQWLEAAVAADTEDRAMQLLGLAWAGRQDGLDMHVAGLLAAQRPDGGWAQVPTRESDAYATGQAIVALQQAGRVASDDPALVRGRQYLVETQRDDGTWHVPTRRTTNPGLPYFETGYPHARDQFISYAGAAWATMALSLAKAQQPSQVLMGGLQPQVTVRMDTLASGGLSPLMQLALSGTVAAVDSAVRAGAEVNAQSPSGMTALMCAVRDSAKVQLLLDAGADPSLVTRTGHSALLLAAATDGATASVRLLLERGAPVGAAPRRSNHGSVSALGRAVARGDSATALMLLEAGEPANGVVGRDVTPLLTAVFHGDAPMTGWLLRHGASVDGVDQGGETPLMIAAIDGRTVVVEALLRGGATVHAADRDGFTALHHAAEAPDRGNTAIVALLLAAGADREARTRAGETAAALAARWRKPHVAALLRTETGERPALPGSGAPE